MCKYTNYSFGKLYRKLGILLEERQKEQRTKT
jgi:hypothetical protein